MFPNLKRKELIGSGSFGNVYRAELDGKPVAVKILHEHYFREPLSNNKQFSQFEAECKILQNLQHKNVVTLLDFIISHKSPPVLITELLDCDLGEHIRKCRPGKIPFSETVSIMLDVAEGLAFIHQQNPPIIHRDVASKNILLTKERQAKIADVGLAKVLPKGEQNYCSPVPGTPVYAAPETFHPDYDPRFPMSRKGRSPVEYDTKIDIFSLGITLMEVINGKLPNPQPGSSPFTSGGQQIPEKERRKHDIDMMGENKLREIVLCCIDDKSSERPRAEELIQMLRLQSSRIEQKQIIANAHRKIPTTQLLVLGQINVGKSTLIARYFDNEFNDRIFVTMGKDIRVNKILLHDRHFLLKVVDTAGLERHLSALCTSELRKSQGIIIVYDVTDVYSLRYSVDRIYKLIKEKASDHVSLILVGNKADQVPRVISEEEGQRYAKQLNIPFIETSAKTGKNVHEVFEMIQNEIDKRLDLSDIDLHVTSQQNLQVTLVSSTRARNPTRAEKATERN